MKSKTRLIIEQKKKSVLDSKKNAIPLNINVHIYVKITLYPKRYLRTNIIPFNINKQIRINNIVHPKIYSVMIVIHTYHKIILVNIISITCV